MSPKHAAAAVLAVLATACSGPLLGAAPSSKPSPLTSPLSLPSGWIQPSPDPGVMDPPRWPPPAPWVIPPNVYVPTSPEPPGPPLPTPLPQPPPRPGHHPASSIYASLVHGFDISYPQCGSDLVPDGAAFAVVGVNAGKAFTLNRCFMHQWQMLAVPETVYLNSGYNPGNATRLLYECGQQAKSITADPAGQLAYGLGCSTARDTLGALHDVGIAPPPIWWVDVESQNSWDDNDLELNRLSLRGEIDQLAATGSLVGVYASFRDWQAITGGWSYAAIAADWVAGRSPDSACSSPGFSGAPVWLAQEPAVWQDASGLDSDYAC